MISRSEWHPFSIIQVPGTTPRAAFYAEAVSAQGPGQIGVSYEARTHRTGDDLRQKM